MRKTICHGTSARFALFLFAGCSLLVIGDLSTHVVAADKPLRVGPDAKLLTKTRSQAIDFLRTTQRDDGSWTATTAPGITALVVTSLLQSGLPADDPTLSKSLQHYFPSEEETALP